MITKKDFAEYLIKKYADGEKITVEEVKNNPENHVYQSTSCGISLEYLGFLENHKNEKEYLIPREGSFISVLTKNQEPYVKFLSVREMFDLLPETI